MMCNHIIIVDPQQQLHLSHGSHPHSCTPPTLMPHLPVVQESGVSTSNCFGGQNDSYSTGHHHSLDQIHNVMTIDNHHHNNAAALPHKKKSCKEKHRELEMEAQCLHHGNGFADLEDCNGSRVRPYNQEVDRSRGYHNHPTKASYHENGMTDPNSLRVDSFYQQVNRSRGNNLSNALHHEKGLMDLNDCNGLRGRPSNNPASNPRDGDYGSSNYNNHELLQEAPYSHQQSAYNSKISHTSGVKHGHSANGCQEADEPNKEYYGDHLTAQYQDYNSTNTQPKVSLRHQSQGAYPSPAKLTRSNNQLDAGNSKGHHNRSETDSGGASYDQVSSNKEKRNIKHQNQGQAGTGEIVGGADAAQFLQDPHSVSNSGSGDQQDDDVMEPNYHEIKGSYPMSDRPNAKGMENEEHGEEEAADTQAQGVDVHVATEENSGQEFDEQGNSGQSQLGSQETRHNNTQWTRDNASKQPKQTRKATQKPNRTGGGSGNHPSRKRSATHPPPSDRAKVGVTKGESKKKRSRTVTNGGSHIPIPGTRQNRNFSKQAPNQPPSNNKSMSRNDEFSRRLPLPPISSDVSKGSMAKKSSTKLVSKSQSKVNRPSTQQSKQA